jgi:hypothetical protein
MIDMALKWHHKNNKITYFIAFWHSNTKQHAPKFLKRPKGGSQSETMEQEDSWGTLFNS